MYLKALLKFGVKMLMDSIVIGLRWSTVRPHLQLPAVKWTMNDMEINVCVFNIVDSLSYVCVLIYKGVI